MSDNEFRDRVRRTLATFSLEEKREFHAQVHMCEQAIESLLRVLEDEVAGEQWGAAIAFAALGEVCAAHLARAEAGPRELWFTVMRARIEDKLAAQREAAFEAADEQPHG